MSTALNAVLMLAATLAGFVVLARLLQAARSRRLESSPSAGTSATALLGGLPAKVLGGLLGGLLGGAWRGATLPAPPSRLAIEQACALDARRRLILVRCDDRRVLLLTGGPADLVVLTLGATP